MTIFVDDVPTTYSDRQHSHKAAGAYLAACQIRHSAWGAGRTVDVWTDKSLAAWPSPLQAQAAKHVWAVAHPMEFTGEVVSLIGAGAFVAFDGYEGLLPVRKLSDDWWELNELETMLIGTRTGKRIRLGDQVTVQVDSIDAPRGRVDLLPVTV